MAFLEERFPLQIDYGSAFGEPYAVDEIITASGGDYRRMRHPYPRFRYEIGIQNRPDTWVINNILDFYHRSGGRFGGFRVKNHADFSTNGYRGQPTPFDQECIETATAGEYQLVRWYGPEGVSTSTRRRIRKPVSGSVLVGIIDEDDNQVELENQWSVDTTTGVVTFDANETNGITGITQENGAVFTIGAHTLSIGDTFHVSAVVGMTEVNGLRVTVTGIGATTVTTDLDTTGFTTYSSGGTINTRPQSGETVKAGCYFDLPVRFETDLTAVQFVGLHVLGTSITVVEILNP